MPDNLPRLPVWVAPLDTGQPNAQDLNDLGTTPKANFAAANQIIPITYGRDRLFGQPFVVHVDETLGYLYTAMSFCEGQIAGFEQTIIGGANALTSGQAFEGVKNRGFENGDKTGWDAEADQDGTVNATVSQNGDYGMNIPAQAATAATQTSNRLLAPPEGTVITFKAWAARNALPTSLPDTDSLLIIKEATTTGGPLSVSSGVVQVTGGDQTVAGWQQLEIEYTVPAGVVEYVIGLEVDNSGTAVGSWDFDDVTAQVFSLEDANKEAGIEISAYVGTQTQQFDGMLSSVLAGYTDDLPGLAYIVMRCPAGSTQGFPRLEAIIQGRLVYDPRLDTTRTDITPNGSGPHRENDSTTWTFSQNPTLCFRDLLTNFTGWTVLDQGVADNADENDSLLSGVARRSMGLTLSRANTVDSWVKGFRTYMGAFLNWENGKIRVIPNRPDVEAPGAINLDGTAACEINMGDEATFDLSLVDHTFELSCNPTALEDDKVLLSKKAVFSGIDDGYAIYTRANGEVRVAYGDGADVTIGTFTGVLTVGTYTNLAVVMDFGADEMHLYVDGLPHASNPVSTTAVGGFTNTADFVIGNDGGGGNEFNGLIDEVRVWNDIRTPAEILACHNKEIENPDVDSSLIGYWKMNEASSATTAVDSSGSAINGTLSGTAAFTFGNAQIIPDGVAMHITPDDIVKDSLDLKRRSLRSVPNSVAIDYEDSSGTRWFTARTQADSVRVTNGDEARRLSRVSLPGIHNASQASREATERLNWYLTDLNCTVTLFDEGWNLTHGSIVAVTHPIGLDAKLFRVRQTSAASGRWTVDLTEYDPAIYSDAIVADPTIPDTNLGNPLSPPTPENLSLVEELFNYKTGTTGSRVRVTWAASGYPFLSQYLIEGYVGGAKVWATTTQANNIVSPPVEEIVDSLGTPTDYEVRVSIQSPFASGTPATQNVQIEGKFAIPGDPTGAVVVQTLSDAVEFTWLPAVDIDIWRYEVRQGDPTVNNTWELATTIDIMDDTDRLITGLPLGAHRFFVKAIDSVRQESANAAFADVTLTAPAPVAGLFGFEVASEVRLNWPAVTTGFVERYRIAYSDIPETFETTLDVVDTLRFQTKDVPEGTFTFKAYSLDKSGNEAATAATIDIEVTSDADAFLADSYDFSFRPDTEPDIIANGSLTNVVEWDIRTDNKKYYVTNMADSFAVTPTDFIAADPLANYHSTGASTWLSETKDFGLLLTGSWNLTHDTTALQGVFDIVLELSADDVTYVAFGGQAKGEYRYARVRITTEAAPGTATAYVLTPVMNLKINVVPLEESGESTSSPNTGVGKTLNLSREYTALKEITTQPKNTITGSGGGDAGSAVTSIVDNIVIGPNTGVQTNTTRYLDGGDIAAFEFSGATSATIEFWMRHSGGAQGVKQVMEKRNGTAAGWSINFAESTENVSFTVDDGTDEVTLSLTDACPNDGNWHHIAFVLDRSSDVLRGYVDGVATGSTPSTAAVGALSSATAAFRIFSNSAATVHWDNGFIDQVRVWDDIRTPAEILANYDIALDMTVTQANLIAYWLMDGSIGANVGTLTDETTNAYTLTPTGVGNAVFVDPGEAGNTVQKINSFDVYIFDIFGQQLAEQFQWKWKAV